jgi:hypothetical protein
MPFALVFSIAAPAVGLLLLPAIALIPRLRPYGRFIVPVAAGFALLGVLTIPFESARSIPVSRWRPSAFFGTSLMIGAKPALWALATAAVAATAAAALVQLSRRAQSNALVGVSALGLVAAALCSFWGDNLLTVLFFWGWFDLLWVLGLAAVGASARRVALSGCVNLLATGALLAGALIFRAQASSISWRLLNPAGLGRDLLVLAGVLRLGLYPLHLTAPVGVSRSAPGALAQFMGPVLGWGYLVQLLAEGGVVLSGMGWLTWVGMASLAAGGLLAFTRSASSEVLPWAALAATGTVILGATNAGGEAPLVLAGGAVSWVLGVALLYLGSGLEQLAPWWVAPSLLGGLALLGAPLTPGSVVTAAVMDGDFAALEVVKVLLLLLGRALLVAGLVRHILRPAQRSELGRLEIAARATGLALPGVLLLLGGIFPSLLFGGLGEVSFWEFLAGPGVLGWGLWLLSVGAGIVLFRLVERFRGRVEPLLSLLFDLVSLDWLLRMLLGGLARVARLLHSAAELVEGAGAVLWAAAIFLLLVLTLVGR